MPSVDHILTTHVGSLPRPTDLTQLMFAHQEGDDADLTIDERLPDAVDDIVGAGCDMAFDGNLQVAILLSQRLIGRKQWTR